MEDCGYKHSRNIGHQRIYKLPKLFAVGKGRHTYPAFGADMDAIIDGLSTLGHSTPRKNQPSSIVLGLTSVSVHRVVGASELENASETEENDIIPTGPQGRVTCLNIT